MWIYNLSFFIFALFYLPVFAVKIRQEERPGKLLRERFGFFDRGPRAQKEGKTLWLHAVSVGEAMVVRRFTELFLKQFPAWNIVLTTVTPTGQKIARQSQGPRVEVRYFPFDFSFAQKRFLDYFRPDLVLLTETEIWPNLILEAARREIPVGIINARLSARSRGRYGALNPLFGSIFRKISFVLAQTEEDRQRFIELGVEPGKTLTAGNMKFDQAVTAAADGGAELKAKWGFAPKDLVWIAGSTHPGEEEILFKTFAALGAQFPDLKMVLAPRHIERASALLKMAESHACIRAGLAAAGVSGKNLNVVILDQIGVLKSLYQFADVVFMGGSLVPHGGQNPIEAAFFRKPVLYGPHYFNFQEVYGKLQREEAVLKVDSAQELESALRGLLASESKREMIGRNALRVVETLQGATRRHLEWLSSFLNHKEERNQNVTCNEKLFSASGRRV